MATLLYNRNNNGNTVNAADHYAYGLRMQGRNFVTDNEGNRYQFTGHEFDGETGYEYHGARYYNEEFGRYMSVDPLAAKFYAWSPYNYTFSNPLRFVDPSGMGPEDIIKIYKTGQIERTAAEGDDQIVDENWKLLMTVPLDANGQSQIGDLTTITMHAEGQGGTTSDKYSFFQIQDYELATSVFELLATNSQVEFSMNKVDFEDGFTTNILTTNYLINGVYPFYSTYYSSEYDLGKSSDGTSHSINKGKWIEDTHSHPDLEGIFWEPSGFHGKMILGSDGEALSLCKQFTCAKD